jgi:hypothetical protein
MVEPRVRTARRTGVSKRALAAVPALAAVLFAGACADDTAGPTGAGGTPTPSLSAVPSAVSPSPSSGAGELMTLRGTVTEGVEAGCLLLKSGAVSYLLQGPAARELKPGDRVEVDGRVAEGMLSICQQGTIFTVTAVRPG